MFDFHVNSPPICTVVLYDYRQTLNDQQSVIYLSFVYPLSI